LSDGLTNVDLSWFGLAVEGLVTEVTQQYGDGAADQQKIRKIWAEKVKFKVGDGLFCHGAKGLK
jgi:hypothetical protein